MNAVFRQRGDAVDYIPEADVSAGDVVVQNDLVGIAKLDIKAGERGALALTGVYAFPKPPEATFAAGVKLHWASEEAIVTPEPEYPYLGKTVLAAAEGDETVLVRLDQ